MPVSRLKGSACGRPTTDFVGRSADAVPYSLYRRMIGDVPGSFLRDEKYLGNLEKAMRINRPIEEC